MSGGMRQRVMIAMALSCKPKLLIADEPTTALDVTIQAQILDLMKRLGRELGTSIILITHDLGVVCEVCSRVMIVYCGRVVEEGNADDIFGCPAHPYTRGLLDSLPKGGNGRLYVIPGSVPSPNDYPSGCVFHPRCARVTERCSLTQPDFAEISPRHKVRCWLHGSGAEA